MCDAFSIMGTKLDPFAPRHALLSGATSVEQVRANAQAAELSLSRELFDEIEGALHPVIFDNSTFPTSPAVVGAAATGV